MKVKGWLALSLGVALTGGLGCGPPPRSSAPDARPDGPADDVPLTNDRPASKPDAPSSIDGVDMASGAVRETAPSDDDARPRCKSSEDCVAGWWCNPMSGGICQDRQVSPPTFVANVMPIIAMQGCADCHSTPGMKGAAPLQDGVSLLFNVSANAIWNRLVTMNKKTCGGGSRRVCIDEPKSSLLVTRILSLPGNPTNMGHPVFDDWSDPNVQTLLRWMAAGAMNDAPADPLDAGTDATFDTPPATTDVSKDVPAPEPPACTASDDPAKASCVVTEASGIFVAPSGSDATATGTRLSPFRTLRGALTAARTAGKRVYACAGDYVERLDVGSDRDGTVILGGFDCVTWKYTGAKLRLRPTGVGPAIAVHDLATGFDLHDADVVAPEQTAPGASSIAALVTNTHGVRFVRVSLKAGKGAAGAPGQTGMAGDTQALPSSPDGQDGTTLESLPPIYVGVAGGAAGSRACVSGASRGGSGGGYAGYQGFSSGGFGFPGSPLVPMSAPTAGAAGGGFSGCSGGTPGPQYGSSSCGAGQPGAEGATGMAAQGAQGTGALSAQGWLGLTGAIGKSGGPGQGGGGGGAASGGCYYYSNGFDDPLNYCGCGTIYGGGGGAAGGCGGAGGGGGGPGGASIALVSFASEVTLQDCALTSAAGGDGGSGGGGGIGQDSSGMPGKSPAGPDPQNPRACTGGLGGRGGKGGPGGGGQGGHSLGIAFTGTMPARLGATTITHGSSGTGGLSGDGSPAPYAGVAGLANDTLSAWSDTTVDRVPPAQVTGVKSKATSCVGFEITWLPEPDAVNYEICAATEPGSCALTAIVGKVTTHSFSALAPATIYSVQVRAVDAFGNSGSWSASVAAMTAADTGAPQTPPNLTASPRSSQSITVSFGLSEDDCVQSYQLKYELCTSTSMQGCAGAAASWSLGNNNATISGLAATTTYFVSARAVDLAGNRSAPATVSVTTKAVPTFANHIKPFIAASCTGSDCHNPLGYPPYAAIPTDYDVLRNGKPLGNMCPNWIATGGGSAALENSFLYAITQHAVCGHNTMSPSSSPDVLEEWLLRGAPP